jgi:hypothetical protein
MKAVSNDSPYPGVHCEEIKMTKKQLIGWGLQASIPLIIVAVGVWISLPKKKNDTTPQTQSTPTNTVNTPQSGLCSIDGKSYFRSREDGCHMEDAGIHTADTISRSYDLTDNYAIDANGNRIYGNLTPVSHKEFNDLKDKLRDKQNEEILKKLTLIQAEFDMIKGKPAVIVVLRDLKDIASPDFCKSLMPTDADVLKQICAERAKIK